MQNFILEGALWYPTRHIGTNKLVYKVYAALAHYVPAYIIDTISRISGKKPM